MTDGAASLDEIERSWNPAATHRSAMACFADVIARLGALGIAVDELEVLAIGTTMWAALDNGGKLPGAAGHERADEVKRLGDALGRHWPLIEKTILDGGQLMHAAGIGFCGEGGRIDCLAALFALRLMWWQWSERCEVSADGLAAARAALDPEFVLLARAWMTSPAGPIEPGASSRGSAERLALLAADWGVLRSFKVATDAVGALTTRSRTFREGYGFQALLAIAGSS